MIPSGSHPSLADVEAARRRIEGMARTTPLVESPSLSKLLTVPVALKAECLQETGSFKVRGAANALLSLSEEARRAGVVAVSSGNHGRAVAHVARILGIPATVYVSGRVPPAKVGAIEALGAKVVVAGPDQEAAEAAAREAVASTGASLIHPFDDPAVIAGQGTVFLEVFEEAPVCSDLVVPLSGGGLISGMAVAAKALSPGIGVVGVSQEAGAAMHQSLRAGRVVDVVEEDTLADALAGGLGPDNRFTFELCRLLVDDSLLVSEEEIGAAMAFLYREHGWRVEGGGAVGVAALLAGEVAPGGPTVVVVSGGNVSDGIFDAVVHRGRRR